MAYIFYLNKLLILRCFILFIVLRNFGYKQYTNQTVQTNTIHKNILHRSELHDTKSRKRPNKEKQIFLRK